MCGGKKKNTFFVGRVDREGGAHRTRGKKIQKTDISRKQRELPTLKSTVLWNAT